MKLLICLTFLTFANLANANEAQLGVIIGSTTGLSAKYDLGGDRAIDGALSYSNESRYGMSLHADYLINKAHQFNVGNINPLNLYYGLGLRLLDIRDRTYYNNSASRIGIRGPIGIYYRTSEPKLEIFGEIAPTLDITPRTDVYFAVGLGVRFIF